MRVWEQFTAWSKASNLALTEREALYLERAQTYHSEQEKIESARQEREAQLEQRSQTVLRALVAVFAISTLIAGGLTVFAFAERSRAQDALATSDASLLLAEQRSGEIQSRVLVDNARDAYEEGDVMLATMLSLEAMDISGAPDIAQQTFETVCRGAWCHPVSPGR